VSTTFKTGDRVRHAYTSGWLGTVLSVKTLRSGKVRARVAWDGLEKVGTHDTSLLRKESSAS
jgi:hypothetical protein